MSPFNKDLQTEALTFASKQIKPFSAHWDKSLIFPKETFGFAGKFGYGGVCGPENYGGRNAQRMGASVIFQAMAESDVGVSAYMSIHNMTGDLLNRFGSQALKDLYLRKLFSMEKIACYCLTEPNAGSDAMSLVKERNSG